MRKYIKYGVKESRAWIMRGLGSLLAATVLIPSLGGCGMVSEDLPECPADDILESDKVLLQFNMETGALLTNTRSDSYHVEVNSEWPSFENQVNIRDLGLFIFMGEGVDAPLIAKNTQIANSSISTDLITGTNGFYTITMSVERDEIDSRMEADDTSLTLRILVLANCYSSGNSGGGNFNALTANVASSTQDATTYQEIMNQVENWGFNISEEIYSPNEGDSMVSGAWKGYIPMFGTNTFVVTREALLESTMGEMIELGEVNLLRALAKVRVIDNIANKKNGVPCISEVSFRSQTNMAYSLPANAISYKDGEQVHKAKIHTKSDDNIITYAFKLGTLSEGSDTRIGYVAEQSIGQELPSFFIKVKTKEATATSAAEYQEYEVPMSGYGDQDFKFDEFNDGLKIPNILRNHIYTLSVDEVETGVPLKITLNVDDWVSTPIYELDYTDIPVVQSTINWEEGTYSNNNEENGELSISNFTEGNATAAVCTFNISRPLNATWTATLIPANEFSDGAFEFEIENEDGGYSTASTMSGTIDGNDITLRIIGTNPSPAQTNEEYLQITVMLADGTIMEANICPADKNYSRYKIIQTLY